jgi:zinc transport system substrate-binding protein
MQRSAAAGIVAAGMLGLGAAALVGGCERTAPPLQQATAIEPVVMTATYPMAWVCEQLLGGAVPVVMPVGPGEDPAHWRPSAEALTRYQNAAVVVLNGAGFEGWAETASLPASRTVDSSAGLPEGFIVREGVTHSHGTAGEHSHEGVDGHTWLDPVILTYQAGRVRDGLVRAFPEHALSITSNFDALSKRLAALDAEHRELGERLEGVVVVTSHPAYGYLARRYGWDVRELDLDPAQPFTLGVGQEVGESVDGAGPRRAMLWESQPTDPAMFERVGQAAGLVSVVFSPGETLDPADRAAGKDYLSIMRENLERVRDAVGSLPEPSGGP